MTDTLDDDAATDIAGTPLTALALARHPNSCNARITAVSYRIYGASILSTAPSVWWKSLGLARGFVGKGEQAVMDIRAFRSGFVFESNKSRCNQPTNRRKLQAMRV